VNREFEKAKVVRIIARLNIGGPAIQAVMLTECLASEEFTSFLISGKIGEMEGDMLPDALERNIHPIIFPELGREISSFNDVVVFFKLVKFLRKVRPHIVHTHTAKAGTLGRLAAWVARVPVKVHTFHGHVFSGYFGWGKTKVYILIERVLALLSDRILVLSEHQRQELVDVYRIAPSHKFQIVPLGFNLEPFFSLSEATGGTPNVEKEPSPLIIGHIGRLVEIKNPFLALDALRLLVSQSRSPFQLWIAGGGPLEGLLKQAVQKEQFSGGVRFLGWQRDMAQLYSSLDIVILTSLNEGTPAVLIEAMASGKPFIATEVGGVRDLMVGVGEQVSGKNGGQFTVYENGILVSSQDVHGLADALEFLASDPGKRTAMGRAGRKFAKAKFTKERLLKDIRSLYGDLLKKNGFHFQALSLVGSKKD
jgi:glycosyltransferase involved in cell wall biosynthesis